ncbi:4-coumarate--CoA ligase-like 5 [Temnothorax curvispinosus]|uniref:4-coumarate--CoA ligase-like 5 n=1 Tax=Temnothorax curvispinosus TaxID=300111 RepID=A0A6J1PRF7_9HYME|nr:4-coumarate--CoA ligase-like 5 [Temnothorax curvispinosus]XP_024871898.1 4-coumarate--CoA ligase-like 5 [Temnothorax curvispinosus]
MFSVTSTWHCTGDYGYYEKDGKLIIIDNINRLIKYKEYHISPLRIEKVLQWHPAVAEVTVLPVPDIDNGQHPRAFIEIKHGAKVTAEDLNQLVEEHLPDIYKLRGGVYVTTLMPHLPNGKIDRMLVQRRSLSTL